MSTKLFGASAGCVRYRATFIVTAIIFALAVIIPGVLLGGAIIIILSSLIMGYKLLQRRRVRNKSAVRIRPVSGFDKVRLHEGSNRYEFFAANPFLPGHGTTGVPPSPLLNSKCAEAAHSLRQAGAPHSSHSVLTSLPPICLN